MPLVRVSLQSGRTPAQKKAIADSIYEAMRETVNIPEDDRFILLDERTPENVFIDPGYMGISRTSEAIIIEITFRKGRTAEMKQALYRQVVNRISQSIDLSPNNVMIVLHENDTADWSFGNGVAQYI
jgi:4-oxalocrotonate tautomerase